MPVKHSRNSCHINEDFHQNVHIAPELTKHHSKNKWLASGGTESWTGINVAGTAAKFFVTPKLANSVGATESLNVTQHTLNVLLFLQYNISSRFYIFVRRMQGIQTDRMRLVFDGVWHASSNVCHL